MSAKRVPWFERVWAWPAAVRLVFTTVLALTALLFGLLPGALPATQLQLLFLFTVLVSAVTSGLTAALVSATAGFGLMLWRAMDTAAGGGWSLSAQAAFEAFLWFAVAKLAAALVAARQGLVTRLFEANQKAEAEARRQALLLSDMSHRFSNDMHLLVSMLQIQAAADPEAADALHKAAGRVLVLGRVHGRLSSGAEQEAVVDSRLFLEGLVGDLRASVDGLRPVALTVAAESHALPLAQAGDVGLVVNELITNAFKHAFPGGREGVVRVSFRREEGSYELVVTDNGIGTASEASARGGGGLGTRILRALAMQLGGRLEIVSGEVGGTQHLLRFPVRRPGVDHVAAATMLQEQPGGSRQTSRQQK